MPGVWMADALASVSAAVTGTGYAALDAELPGAGWPLGALVELLQPTASTSVWPLMLPALARQAQAGRVALIQPPHQPYLPALAAAGVPWSQTLWIQAATPAQAAWAGEQALRCQDVAAVVAWLPRAQAGDLRRLHQAAASTGALLFVMRPAQAAHTASPARVRLRVTAAVRPFSRLRLVGTGDLAEGERASWPQLRIDLLKRRGPPMPMPLWLPACGEAMLDLLRAAQAQAQAQAVVATAIAHAPPSVRDGMARAPWPQSPMAADAAGHRGPSRMAPAPTVHRLLPRRRPVPLPGAQTLPLQEDGHALAGVAVAAA